MFRIPMVLCLPQINAGIVKGLTEAVGKHAPGVSSSAFSPHAYFFIGVAAQDCKSLTCSICYTLELAGHSDMA